MNGKLLKKCSRYKYWKGKTAFGIIQLVDIYIFLQFNICEKGIETVRMKDNYCVKLSIQVYYGVPLGPLAISSLAFLFKNKNARFSHENSNVSVIYTF